MGQSPGLSALIRLAEKARTSDEKANFDTAALTPRHAIPTLVVTEAKTEALHFSNLEKW